jgi:sn-2 palmitoyl-lipid 9-desaturase
MRDATSKSRKLMLTPVVVIAVVHCLAVFGLFHFSKANLIGFVMAHFLVGCVGGVIGLHRYFAHKSFRCGPAFEALLGVLATLNLQGGLIRWAAHHRAHHRFTEEVGDPHSARHGFLWSHILWLFYLVPNGFKKASIHVKDLSTKPALLFLDRHSLLVNSAVALVFWLVTLDFGLFLWVFPVRIVVMWHTTWLVNSYLHSASFTGAREPVTKNSVAMSLALYGEGWHSNHHRFPGLPRAGLSPLEVDPAYYVILALKWLGLIRLNSSYDGVTFSESKGAS